MRLSELLPELNKRGITVVNKWELRKRKGITLGDPLKYFPHPSGPQYPIDVTASEDPDLTDDEVAAIRRRFPEKK
ncbi:MAG TPA: hypothetical protein VES66_09595 [Terriglobales bacterium]|nr:hypothetical protein [Terriglobales bacterium]